MTLEDRIDAFIELGGIIEGFLHSTESHGEKTPEADLIIIEKAIGEAGVLNPWFTRENIMTALYAISRNLTRKNLEKWLNRWNPALLSNPDPLNVGIVMAGNLPLVGFHDFLSVLITGHKFTGKLSSRDNRLLPMIGDLISVISKDLYKNIEFTEERLTGIDAIIATGSNNTFRYFNYYFGKYPHIFRKNRNSVAVLHGDETPGQIASLGDDLFTYFGLGCRSVSKIFVPVHFDVKSLYEAFNRFSSLTDHHKYMNNYLYYRSIYLMNKIPHLDNGFLILKQDPGYQSPVGVLFYEPYSSIESLMAKLISDSDLIQCIAASELDGLKTVPFGKTQFPDLWDYADNVNTIDFLINLVEKRGHDI